MDEFEKWWRQQGFVEETPLILAYKDAMRTAFKVGMLTAAEIARVGASKTPELNSKHSIRSKIADRIKAKAEELC